MEKQWPDRIVVEPISRVEGEVLLPGSKSLSNRALLLAALAEGETRLENMLYSDDTHYMRSALETMGVPILEESKQLRVTGRGDALSVAKTADLFLGNAGTAMRPLAAVLSVTPGLWRLGGEPRMEERPIGDQVEALLALGAEIRYLKNRGYPPLEIEGKRLKGGVVQVKGNTSSQFLTALLLAAPLFEKGLSIEVAGDLVSKPYIDLTLKVMERFGISAMREGYQRFAIPGREAGAQYRSPGNFFIEGDASAASYFLAAGAAAGGVVRVVGVGTSSTQGDVAFAEVLAKMGATIRRGEQWIEVEGGSPLRGVDLDLNHIPDAAMTLATLALFAQGKTTLRNIGNWRVKETDRLHAMATELKKVGATVEEGEDWLSVSPPAELRTAEIATYNDHRIAMCFSLVAIGGVPITILDPSCTAKTFPEYFETLAQICK